MPSPRHWVHLGPDFAEGGERMTNNKYVVPRAEKLRWLKDINPKRFSQSALVVALIVEQYGSIYIYHGRVIKRLFFGAGPNLGIASGMGMAYAGMGMA